MPVLACPICESHEAKDYTVIARGSQPTGGVEDFAVLRCRRHGVEFADAPGIPASAEGFERSLSDTYGAGDESLPRYVDFLDRVESVVGRRSGGTLHDVGCGNGQLLFEARRRRWNIQGNDIAPSVKGRLEPAGVACWIGRLSDLPLEPDSCDLVTSFCVLPHHLSNPTPDMLAAYRMLKPGGWLALQLPADGLWRRTGKAIYRLYWPWRATHFSRYVIANLYGPGGHQFAYTRENLATYLRECGFGQVVYRTCFPSPRFTLARFNTKPPWVRVGAWTAVTGLMIAGRLLDLPNHMIAYARKPLAGGNAVSAA